MPLQHGLFTPIDKMPSSIVLDPLSDHLSRLLIAHSNIQTCSSQFSKNHLFWHLSLLQKQLNSSLNSALAAEDPIYSSQSSSCCEETNCGATQPFEDQGLEFSAYDGSQDQSMAVSQNLLSSSTTEDALSMDDLYSSDEFRMFEFKVRRCTRGRSHDWTECPFAHPGEKARRRDPRRFHYSGTACADFRKGSCQRGDGCEFAHGVFECWLHPARYRTQPCKDGVNCRRRVCFFAHTAQELRVLSATSAAALNRPGTSRTFTKNLQFGSSHCNLGDYCTICASAAIKNPSPVSTLIGLPESPPSLSPPLSPSSPFTRPELSLAHHPLTSRQKLARHLSFPSGDETPSLHSFFSAPSSPSAGSLLLSHEGSPKVKAMADLAPAEQQLRHQSASQNYLLARTVCSASSPLGYATSSTPCSSLVAIEDPVHIRKRNSDRNAELEKKTEETDKLKVYGRPLITANSAGESRSKLCERTMTSFKRRDSFPDLEWVDELVGYN